MEPNDFYSKNELNKILSGEWPKLNEFYNFMNDMQVQINKPFEPKKTMKELIKDYCYLLNAYNFSIEYDYGHSFQLMEIIIIIRFKLPFEDGKENIHLVFENKAEAKTELLKLIKNYKL